MDKALLVERVVALAKRHTRKRGKAPLPEDFVLDYLSDALLLFFDSFSSGGQDYDLADCVLLLRQYFPHLESTPEEALNEWLIQQALEHAQATTGRQGGAQVQVGKPEVGARKAKVGDGERQAPGARKAKAQTQAGIVKAGAEKAKPARGDDDVPLHLERNVASSDAHLGPFGGGSPNGPIELREQQGKGPGAEHGESSLKRVQEKPSTILTTNRCPPANTPGHAKDLNVTGSRAASKDRESAWSGYRADEQSALGAQGVYVLPMQEANAARQQPILDTDQVAKERADEMARLHQRLQMAETRNRTLSESLKQLQASSSGREHAAAAELSESRKSNALLKRQLAALKKTVNDLEMCVQRGEQKHGAEKRILHDKNQELQALSSQQKEIIDSLSAEADAKTAELAEANKRLLAAEAGELGTSNRKEPKARLAHCVAAKWLSGASQLLQLSQDMFVAAQAAGAEVGLPDETVFVPDTLRLTDVAAGSWIHSPSESNLKGPPPGLLLRTEAQRPGMAIETPQTADMGGSTTTPQTSEKGRSSTPARETPKAHGAPQDEGAAVSPGLQDNMSVVTATATKPGRKARRKRNKATHNGTVDTDRASSPVSRPGAPLVQVTTGELGTPRQLAAVAKETNGTATRGAKTAVAERSLAGGEIPARGATEMRSGRGRSRPTRAVEGTECAPVTVVRGAVGAESSKSKKHQRPSQSTDKKESTPADPTPLPLVDCGGDMLTSLTSPVFHGPGGEQEPEAVVEALQEMLPGHSHAVIVAAVRKAGGRAEVAAWQLLQQGETVSRVSMRRGQPSGPQLTQPQAIGKRAPVEKTEQLSEALSYVIRMPGIPLLVLVCDLEFLQDMYSPACVSGWMR